MMSAGNQPSHIKKDSVESGLTNATGHFFAFRARSAREAAEYAQFADSRARS